MISRLPLLLAAASLVLAGCGRVFDNVEESAGAPRAQTEAEDAGIPTTAVATIALDGREAAILSLSGIRPAELVKSRVVADEIVVRVSLRSEKPEYAAAHVREIENLAAADGIYSLESAFGCRYRVADAGTARERLAIVGGSCVQGVAIELPDHDLPRAFLGARPLFSGEIELADLKKVFGARARDPELPALAREFAARLPEAAKTVSVAELGALLPALADDAKRIDVVAILAPRISDPANADALPAAAFTNAANRARATKLLRAYAP